METLIFDRGPADYYNAVDLSRVENAIQELSAKLRGMGYAITGKARQVWNVQSIPRQSSIDAIRAAITEMGAALYGTLPADWRDLPAGATTTGVQEWNAWEWDLQMISTGIDAVIAGRVFRRAGTVFMISGGIYAT